MSVYRRRSKLFDRIGDQYRHFIDGDHFLGRSAFEDNWMTRAESNLKRNGEGYQLEVALPGFDKKEISVTVHNDQLEIVAQSADQADVESDYVIQELNTSTKSRIFKLRPEIDTDQIKVNFKNGILRIALPYKEEKLSQQDDDGVRTIKVA
ncbi:MAG: Hsp20/alpha crystallin family protein [Cyclobacteriaceae bacterium]